MAVVDVGQTFEYEFTCTRRENGVLTLYNPTVVKCSFFHEDGSEEVYKYLGSDANDDDLILLSVGTFRVTYTPTVPDEMLRVRAYTEDVVSGKTWFGKAADFALEVKADPRKYEDTAVGTGTSPTPTPEGQAVTHRIYHGAAVAALAGTSAIEAALESDDVTIVNDLTFTVSPSNQKVYVAYPVSIGDPQWTHFGWSFTEEAPRTVQLHGANGALMNYTLREIATSQTGTNLAFVVEFSHA